MGIVLLLLIAHHRLFIIFVLLPFIWFGLKMVLLNTRSTLVVNVLKAIYISCKSITWFTRFKFVHLMRCAGSTVPPSIHNKLCHSFWIIDETIFVFIIFVNINHHLLFKRWKPSINLFIDTEDCCLQSISI